MEVVKVNPSEYGIEEKKASELIGNLPQLQSERDVLEGQYNEVIKMDIESVETSKVARELRLKIRDNRTKGIAVWHRTTKEVFLRAGQYVDAVKNREVTINERMESNLEEIEKYAEIQEQKRRDELKAKRISELEVYSEFVPFGIDLGAMSDDEYQKVFNGAKLQFDAKIEAEKLEAERIAEEKRIEAERIEEQRLENERLKAEAEKRKKELQKEREERERIERELQAKKSAEIKAEKDRKLAEEQARKEAEKLAKAPIKKQLNIWVNGFSIASIPADNEVSKEIEEKFNAFKSWAIKQIENL